MYVCVVAAAAVPSLEVHSLVLESRLEEAGRRMDTFPNLLQFIFAQQVIGCCLVAAKFSSNSDATITARRRGLVITKW